MNILKNISEAHCAELDRMPEADKKRLSAMIIEEQEWRKGLLNVKQVGDVLNLSRDGVELLALRFLTPFRKTSRGMRQVKSIHKDDLRAWLVGLNPAYADYDPDEPLLKPANVVALLKENGEDITTRQLRAMRSSGGPEYVQLNQRVTRYRTKHVLEWVHGKTTGVNDG